MKCVKCEAKNETERLAKCDVTKRGEMCAGAWLAIPWIARPIYGLRPGQWLILIGLAMLIIGQIGIFICASHAGK